jgi:hypothetical protein
VTQDHSGVRLAGPTVDGDSGQEGIGLTGSSSSSRPLLLSPGGDGAAGEAAGPIPAGLDLWGQDRVDQVRCCQSGWLDPTRTEGRGT